MLGCIIHQLTSTIHHNAALYNNFCIPSLCVLLHLQVNISNCFTEHNRRYRIKEKKEMHSAWWRLSRETVRLLFLHNHFSWGVFFCLIPFQYHTIRCKKAQMRYCLFWMNDWIDTFEAVKWMASKLYGELSKICLAGLVKAGKPKPH